MLPLAASVIDAAQVDLICVKASLQNFVQTVCIGKEDFPHELPNVGPADQYCPVQRVQ
jgi:hypothetical protein